LAFLTPFLMFGGQNGVITFSVSLQKITVSNWILTMWRRLMRYFFYLSTLCIFLIILRLVILSSSPFPFQPETIEPPRCQQEWQVDSVLATKTCTIYQP
jgi:hypothetical protein